LNPEGFCSTLGVWVAVKLTIGITLDKTSAARRTKP
jgi:hypothetical protein